MINEEVLRLLDNNGKLLYLLMEEGPLRFEDFITLLNPNEKLQKRVKDFQSKEKDAPTKNVQMKNQPRHFMSRGTVAKHLKYLKDLNRKYIEQVSEFDSKIERTVLKYVISDAGKVYISQVMRREELPARPEQFEAMYYHITEFFEKIGVDQQLYLPQIIKMIARIDQTKFFQLAQTDELFYTLFYIFQNMLEFSLEEEHFRYFALKPFCETYNIQEVNIQYFLEKMLSGGLGIHRIAWEADLFFQKDDIIGAVIYNQILNALEGEVVKRSLKMTNLTPFEQMAKEITEKMVEMKLIRPRIRIACQNYIEILTVYLAIQRGFNRIDIVDYWTPMKQLLAKKESIEITKKIFGKSSEYEILRAIEQAQKAFAYSNIQ